MRLQKHLCRSSCVLALLFGTSNSLSKAQDHSQAISINGSEHPELISDSVAYRLYFSSVSVPRQASPEQTDLQASQLAAIGLSNKDTQAMIKQLAIFRTQFDILVANYNKTAREGHPDVELFESQQALLLANTLAAMKSALSESGMAQLNTYVQNEKRRMQISGDEETQ